MYAVNILSEIFTTAYDDVNDDGGSDDGCDGIEWKQAVVTGQYADEIAQ